MSRSGFRQFGVLGALASTALATTGCVFGAFVAAGPYVGYAPDHGFTSGWSAGAGAAPMFGVAEVDVGQSFRPALTPPVGYPGQRGWPPPQLGAIEKITYVDLKLGGWYGYPSPIIGTLGANVGVAWSDRSARAGVLGGAWLGGSINLQPGVCGAFLESPSPQALSGGVTLLFGVRFVRDSWEVYGTAQGTVTYTWFGPACEGSQ